MTVCFVITAELVSEDFTESLCSQLINQESMKEEKQKTKKNTTIDTANCTVSPLYWQTGQEDKTKSKGQ